MGRMTRLAAAGLAALLWTAAARAVAVGDPADPAALGPALRAAYAAGARDITVRPGTYAMPVDARADAVLLDGWRDATVVADGVTLVFADYRHRAVRLRRCANVTIRGATLRFAVPAFTQGRIVGLGADERGPWCDWQVDAGYPADPAELEQTYNLIDSATRLIKAATSDVGAKSRTVVGPGRFRLRFSRAVPAHAAVGDWLVCRHRAGTTLVHLDECERCTVDRVTCENGGFGTFFETGGGGGNTLSGCVIHPGPTPAAGTEAELVSCGADGFHSVDTTVGPTVRDCTFTGVFLDDCVAIHGTFGTVAAAGGRDVTFTAKGDGGAAVGDGLRFSDADGFLAEAGVAAVVRLPDRTTRVTLDRDLAVPVGAKGNNPDRCGRGYRIVHTRLGDTRSRGILVKADDGLIDGCTIDGCVMSGVSVGPEYYWNEANYARHTVVRHCVFRGCDEMGSDQAAVWVHGDGAIGNRDVQITDNHFTTGPVPTVVRLDWTDGATVMANVVAVDGTMPGGAAVVRLAHSRGVGVGGNTADARAFKMVAIGTDVTGTTGGATP